MKNVLTVEGMSCNHCVNAIDGALKEIGVAAKVDLANKTVTVEYDESQQTLTTIKDAIEEQGFDVL